MKATQQVIMASFDVNHPSGRPATLSRYKIAAPNLAGHMLTRYGSIPCPSYAKPYLIAESEDFRAEDAQAALKRFLDACDPLCAFEFIIPPVHPSVYR